MQQNTIRDALVAAVTLDIFNRHADIVKMADIAQIINVLQAMILTQGDQMITTPTFHMYEMYQLHQNAQVLPMWFSCGNIQYKSPLKSGSVPHLAGSFRKRQKNPLSLVNLNVSEWVQIELDFRGCSSVKLIKARIYNRKIFTIIILLRIPPRLLPKKWKRKCLPFLSFRASVNVFEIHNLEYNSKQLIQFFCVYFWSIERN